MFTQIRSNTYDLSSDEVELHSGKSPWSFLQERWARCHVKGNYSGRTSKISMQWDEKDPELVVINVVNDRYVTSGIIMKRSDLKKMAEFI